MLLFLEDVKKSIDMGVTWNIFRGSGAEHMRTVIALRYTQLGWWAVAPKMVGDAGLYRGRDPGTVQ